MESKRLFCYTCSHGVAIGLDKQYTKPACEINTDMSETRLYGTCWKNNSPAVKCVRLSVWICPSRRQCNSYRNIFAPYTPTISTKTSRASRFCSGGNPAFNHGPLTSYADWRALWFSSVSPYNAGKLSQFALRSLTCTFLRNPSNRAVACPRLTPHGNCNRPFQITCISLFTVTGRYINQAVAKTSYIHQ